MENDFLVTDKFFPLQKRRFEIFQTSSRSTFTMSAYNILNFFFTFSGYLQQGCKGLQKWSWWLIQIRSSLDNFHEG